MQLVCTNETSVNFNMTTRRYIPEDYKLHTSRHENLKSHTAYNFHGNKLLTLKMYEQAVVEAGVALFSVLQGHQ
jgi:hypothetical protein